MADFWQQEYLMAPRTHEELRSHFELHEAGHVFGLFARLRLTRLLFRYPPRLVWAFYVLITCFLSIAIISALAALTGKSVCVSFFGTDGVPALLYSACPRIESTSCLARTCGWTRMRVSSLACDGQWLGRRGTTGRGSLADGARGSVFPERYRCGHGDVARQPSARRRDDADRVAWPVIETDTIADDRGGGVLAGRGSIHHQPVGGPCLPVVGGSGCALTSSVLAALQ